MTATELAPLQQQQMNGGHQRGFRSDLTIRVPRLSQEQPPVPSPDSPTPPSPPPKSAGRTFGFPSFRSRQQQQPEPAASSSSLSLNRTATLNSDIVIDEYADKPLPEPAPPPPPPARELRKSKSSMLSNLMRKRSKSRLRSSSDDTATTTTPDNHPSLKSPPPPLPYVPIAPSSPQQLTFGRKKEKKGRKGLGLGLGNGSGSTANINTEAEQAQPSQQHHHIITGDPDIQLDMEFKDIDQIVSRPSVATTTTTLADDPASPGSGSHSRTYSSDNSFNSLASGSLMSIGGGMGLGPIHVSEFSDPFAFGGPSSGYTPKPRSYAYDTRKISPKSSLTTPGSQPMIIRTGTTGGSPTILIDQPSLITEPSPSSCSNPNPENWRAPESWVVDEGREQPEEDVPSSDDDPDDIEAFGGGGRSLVFSGGGAGSPGSGGGAPGVGAAGCDDLDADISFVSPPHHHHHHPIQRSMSTTSGSTASSADRTSKAEGGYAGGGGGSGAGAGGGGKKKSTLNNILRHKKRKTPFLPPESSSSPASHPSNTNLSSGKGGADPRRYTIRIYRANNTYHVVSVGFQVTVATLTPKLKNRLLSGEDREVYKLYLKEKGRERILAQTERPADIVRRRLEQAGYDVSDGLELLGEEGLSFLLKFVYKSQALGTMEEDIKFPNFAQVDLSGRSLRTIPVTLHIHAHQIVSLYLSRNPMLEIPLDFIQSCTALQELKLSHMAIKKVPHSVKSSSSLLRLDISCNRIADLDEAYLDAIPGLLELQAQNNRMEKLPWYFPKLRTLTYLNISNNKFRTIPSVLCQLTNLQNLDISFNVLQELPEEIGQLQRLETFIMVGNQITKFPTQVKDLISLRYLDCRKNLIADLAEICVLPNLENLYADHNALHGLNLHLGPKLQCLIAAHNEITRLSLTQRVVVIGGKIPIPYSLSTLDISYAKLASWDDLPLSQLTTLRTLRFDHNQFTSIPETIGDLEWLETLSCADNELQFLPDSIGRLQRLEVLDAHSNNLQEVPGTIWNCASLYRINLTSNLLQNWPHPPVPPSSVSLASAANSIINPGASVEALSTRHGYPERKTSTASLNARFPPLAYPLEYLHLGENHITDDVLHPLTVLRELKVLNLSFNKLQDLPLTFFKNFAKLEELYLSGNKLSSIPTEDMNKLVRLQVLYLNGNRLQTLPQELGKIQSLTVLDVGSNLLRYNINNWEFDWNWNFNKNLKYLNLSGNNRLQIKADPKASGRVSRDFRQQTQTQTLAGFRNLTQLRVLGLMDVTITTTSANASVDIPDESDDRRVRTSQSTVCGMSYGIADTLGKNENLHMIDLVHEFPPSNRNGEAEAVFAMFGRAAPPTAIPSSSNRLARYLHDRFIEVLLAQKAALNPEHNEGIQDALRRTFLKLNQDLHDTLFSTRKMSQSVLGASPLDQYVQKSGASGVALYFVGRKIYAANAGNALAVVSRGGTAHALSAKHDPYDRNEAARIRAAEGWISPLGLVNDEIDVSRSFGFFHLLPMVNARPFVDVWDINEGDDFVIIGNRGLWDYISYQTAVDIAREGEQDSMIAAQKLRDLAMSYGADGSTMIMVIGLSDAFKPDRMRKDTEASINSSIYKPLPPRKPIINTSINRLPSAVPPPTGHVALVITDIRNSTHLWQVNPGTHTAIRIHNNLLRRQLRFCGGYEVKTEGDSFFCAFPSTISALWWCLTVQQRLLHEDWPLEILESEDGQPILDGDGRLIARGLSVRMGIHCGQPICETDQTTERMDYFGPIVNRTARISGSALGGQIRVSMDVMREINSKIFENEPDTEFAYLHPVEAIDMVKRIGVKVYQLGEVKMKGLEMPETVSIVYPKGLEGRRHLEEHGNANNMGSRVSLSCKQLMTLGMLCLRLESLATGRLFRPLPERKGSVAGTDEAAAESTPEDLRYFYGDPALLLPPMTEKTSDTDLMLILDSLSGRIDNAIASLGGRLLKSQIKANLIRQGGIDERTLATILHVLNSV